MLLQCSHCGAPLDVSEGVRIVRCAYCGFKTERARMTTISHQTPADFQRPIVWRPPPHVPAPSHVELRYAATGSAVGCVLPIVMLVVIAAIGAGVAATLAKKQGGSVFGGGGISLEKLDGLDLAVTPQALQAKLGGRLVDGDKLYVDVNHPALQQLYFMWEEKERAHVRYVGSIMRDRKGIGQDVCDRMASVIGEFQNKSWYFGDVHASCDPQGSISVYDASRDANDFDEKGAWKARVDVLFRVEIEALLGKKSTVTGDDLRKGLGAGYAAADLAKLDLDADVDGAKKALAKALGGSFHTSDGTSYSMIMAKGPLPQVRVQWDNQKAGKVSSVTFSTLGWQSLGPRLAKVAKCLEKDLGPPKIEEIDHVKKTVYYRFREWQITLYEQSLNLSKPTKETWPTVLRALEGCSG